MKPSSIRWFKRFVSGMVLAVSLLTVVQTKAEDGYRLWLRYDPLPSRMVAVYRPLVKSIVYPGILLRWTLRGQSLSTVVRGCWAFPFRRRRSQT